MPVTTLLPLTRPISRLSKLHPSTTFTRLYSAPTSTTIPASKQKYIPTSGNYPLGFLASSTHVGVKKSNTSTNDVALLVSETPCAAAAVFTTNKFQAAPVTVTREMLRARKGEGVRAVVVNSGCANAVTGKGGLEDARRMGKETDRALGEGDGKGMASVVMSTGVIGQRLPIDRILSGIPTAVSGLGNTHDHWLSAAKAICTTDTFPKLISTSFTLPSYPSTTFSLAGMTKGAGMIHPNMATLLSIICTDAPIAPTALQAALTAAAGRSFNSISIDGDTSTNDTVAILANGAACSPGSPVVETSNSSNAADLTAFTSALTQLMTSLAQLIVRDGEGATKFVTLRVRGAPSRAVGHRLASTIARSPLVKTALYGRDANWGRILCAVGYAEGVEEGAAGVEPSRVGVSFVGAPGGSHAGQELKLLVNGEPQDVDEALAGRMLAEEDLEILVKLKPAEELDQKDVEDEVLFWTCDFSHEYVTINGDYRT